MNGEAGAHVCECVQSRKNTAKRITIYSPAIPNTKRTCTHTYTHTGKEETVVRGTANGSTSTVVADG